MWGEDVSRSPARRRAGQGAPLCGVCSRPSRRAGGLRAVSSEQARQWQDFGLPRRGGPPGLGTRQTQRRRALCQGRGSCAKNVVLNGNSEKIPDRYIQISVVHLKSCLLQRGPTPWVLAVTVVAVIIVIVVIRGLVEV